MANRTKIQLSGAELSPLGYSFYKNSSYDVEQVGSIYYFGDVRFDTLKKLCNLIEDLAVMEAIESDDDEW